MRKNWKTSVLGVLGAGLVWATAKGFIDKDTATFIGTGLIAAFGLVSKDFNISGSDIGLPKPPRT